MQLPFEFGWEVLRTGVHLAVDDLLDVAPLIFELDSRPGPQDREGRMYCSPFPDTVLLNAPRQRPNLVLCPPRANRWQLEWEKNGGVNQSERADSSSLPQWSKLCTTKRHATSSVNFMIGPND